MTASCPYSPLARGGVCFFTAIVVSLCATLTALAAKPPELTGRIVDQADIIPAATRSTIEPKLADLETKSGIQLVVATVNSLDGEEIEPYANELFRSWKLGEKPKNNGVLLLVAPKEKRVRFKVGDFGDGISRGVDDIISVLTTDASEWQQRPSLRVDDQATRDPLNWLIVAGIIALVTLLIVSPGFRWFFLNVALNILLNSGGSRGGGFSNRGGFSGGGGFGWWRATREVVMNISEQDSERISTATPTAESKTSGEIVCVL